MIDRVIESTPRRRAVARRLAALLCAVLASSPVGADTAAPVADAPRYHLVFGVDLTGREDTAGASLTIDQPIGLLREVRFRAPANSYREFSGDGRIVRNGDIVSWRPPATGGRIDYRVNISHERSTGRFDALVTQDWALFRGDDVFPPAAIRQRAGATATSRLTARLPDGWSLVTPFVDGPDGEILIDNPARHFDRPVGWLIAGRLGVRRDVIAGIEVSVAAPVGSDIERIGMLALLRWTMPLLTAEIETRPRRISIVSAGEPMWRGGLSGPDSIYIHADRPLISENATSTLLHELAHVLLPIRSDRKHDWIDEGIAEYVTLEILRRSGTISPERFIGSVKKFRRRGEPVRTMASASANGTIRARAVAIFHDVDDELRNRSDGRADIFDLIRLLMKADRPADLALLREQAATLTGGRPLAALDDRRVPGFSSR